MRLTFSQVTPHPGEYISRVCSSLKEIINIEHNRASLIVPPEEVGAPMSRIGFN